MAGVGTLLVKLTGLRPYRLVMIASTRRPRLCGDTKSKLCLKYIGLALYLATSSQLEPEGRRLDTINESSLQKLQVHAGCCCHSGVKLKKWAGLAPSGR